MKIHKKLGCYLDRILFVYQRPLCWIFGHSDDLHDGPVCLFCMHDNPSKHSVLSIIKSLCSRCRKKKVKATKEPKPIYGEDLED